MDKADEYIQPVSYELPPGAMVRVEVLLFEDMSLYVGGPNVFGSEAMALVLREAAKIIETRPQGDQGIIVLNTEGEG